MPLPDALAFMERGFALAPWNAGTAGLLAGLHRRAGDQPRADALLEDIGDPTAYGAPIDYALYHLACEDIDRAVDDVLAGLRQRHPFMMMVVIGGPYGAALRKSRRWREVADSLKLPD